MAENINTDSWRRALPILLMVKPEGRGIIANRVLSLAAKIDAIAVKRGENSSLGSILEMLFVPPACRDLERAACQVFGGTDWRNAGKTESAAHIRLISRILDEARTVFELRV